jgi:hypothetical protein
MKKAAFALKTNAALFLAADRKTIALRCNYKLRFECNLFASPKGEYKSAAKNFITGGIDFNRLYGWIELKNRLAQTSRFFWRRRWDSNPRAGSSPTKRFRVI